MSVVYILESEEGSHFYVGITDSISARLKKHNAGEVSHTAKFRPWKLRTYVVFTDERRALAFEKYLKTASGRAFSTKRL